MIFVTVTKGSPVQRLLALLVLIVGAISGFITAKAQFLATTFVIVYVGAIAILFLFVLLLLNVDEFPEEEDEESYFWSLPPLLFTLGYLDSYKESEPEEDDENLYDELVRDISYEYQDVNAFAELYTYHSGLFVTTMLILLVTMVGVIVIARPTRQLLVYNLNLYVYGQI